LRNSHSTLLKGGKSNPIAGNPIKFREMSTKSYAIGVQSVEEVGYKEVIQEHEGSMRGSHGGRIGGTTRATSSMRGLNPNRLTSGTA